LKVSRVRLLSNPDLGGGFMRRNAFSVAILRQQFPRLDGSASPSARGGGVLAKGDLISPSTQKIISQPGKCRKRRGKRKPFMRGKGADEAKKSPY
jgi:hypothetical protein